MNETIIALIAAIATGISTHYGRKKFLEYRYRAGNGVERRKEGRTNCAWNPGTPEHAKKAMNEVLEPMLKILVAMYRMQRASAMKDGMDVSFMPENPKDL